MTQEERIEDKRLVDKNLSAVKNYYSEGVRQHRKQLIKQCKIGHILRRLWARMTNLGKVSTKGNVFGRKVRGMLDLQGLKLCVYTCLVGDYDTLKEPVCNESNIDYIAFTDQEIPAGSRWRKIDITSFPEYGSVGPFTFNRMLKCLPHKYLSEYDYSMYIDASIQPIAYMQPLFEKMGNAAFGAHMHRSSDSLYDELYAMQRSGWVASDALKKQLRDYRELEIPEHTGMTENMVLIRRHRDKDVQALMEQWWQEYKKYQTRDQICLPAVMWKMNFDKDMICVLGDSFWENPRFLKIRHPSNPGYRCDVVKN